MAITPHLKFIKAVNRRGQEVVYETNGGCTKVGGNYCPKTDNPSYRCSTCPHVNC